MGLLPEPEAMSGSPRCAWRLRWTGWLMGVVFTGSGALILSFGPEEMAEAEGVPLALASQLGRCQETLGFGIRRNVARKSSLS